MWFDSGCQSEPWEVGCVELLIHLTLLNAEPLPQRMRVCPNLHRLLLYPVIFPPQRAVCCASCHYTCPIEMMRPELLAWLQVQMSSVLRKSIFKCGLKSLLFILCLLSGDLVIPYTLSIPVLELSGSISFISAGTIWFWFCSFCLGDSGQTLGAHRWIRKSVKGFWEISSCRSSALILCSTSIRASCLLFCFSSLLLWLRSHHNVAFEWRYASTDPRYLPIAATADVA